MLPDYGRYGKWRLFSGRMAGKLDPKEEKTKHMQRKAGIRVAGVLGLAAVAGFAYLLRDNTFAVLDPKGVVAEQQRDLLVTATLLMLLIVIPVFVLTFFITWKYRAANTKADYRPEWDSNRRAEALWWGLPLLIITILSVIIWRSSNQLDPYRPLASELRPVTVQVVALQWKWLFIYPDYGVASVNYVRFPAGRPVSFEITSDAPVNSFWIPQLGGQVYAIAGRQTELNLMANEPGRFNGSSANLSGKDFAKMRFIAEATGEKVFDDWIATVRKSRLRLDAAEYARLASPGTQPVVLYAAADAGLYDTIIRKYTQPSVSDR